MDGGRRSFAAADRPVWHIRGAKRNLQHIGCLFFEKKMVQILETNHYFNIIQI